jgi:hypothetical protein
MRLQKRATTFSYTFGDPIIAKPEIIVAIRRLVQNGCQHDDVRPIEGDSLRVECADCGYQAPEVEVAQLVRRAR